ncbi:MAG: Gfo/Idh/MocA family oxidoreductase [Proteobacteria bacterium]|nr:Gfo/Idh/MocA family oxidoreductase [Pseudomonadota bacterium]
MVKIAVIGAGYLGRFHIEKFKKIKNVNLVSVCEVDKKIAKSISDEFGVTVVDDYRALAGKVDAVSIVTPTPSHYNIADFFLKRNTHLFIEKPVTDNINDAKKLLKLKKEDIIIQVGYVERFNPAFRIFKDNLNTPHTVIFKRKAPFTLRGADVDVVFDLMIHDIDLAFNIFEEKPEIAYVRGEKIFTNHNDVVIAGIKFGHTLAHFEISRISDSKERKITALDEGIFIEADLINQNCKIVKNKKEKIYGGEKRDILLEELSDFVISVEKGSIPKVTLEDGIKSLEFADKILRRIRK